MNFSEWDKKLSKEFDLKNYFPDYFTKWVFVFMMVFIVSLSVYDLSLSNWDFKEINYQCNEIGGFCPNPFYNNSNLPAWVYEKVPTDTPFIEGGFTIGRTDWLAKNRINVVLYIVILMFILNHLLYIFKFQSLKYRGKDWHLTKKEDWLKQTEKEQKEWDDKYGKIES